MTASKEKTMAHEMTENDSAVYHKKSAWHGLGNVVDYTLSANSALRESGLGWEVEKTTGISTGGGIWTEDYRGIVRTDTRKVLGIVSPQYQVVQNKEVFRLAEYFSDVATVESAGSVQDGRKCYLLLNQDSFDATANDTVTRYMAMFWGHDGKSSIIIKPTSIRVVCKNTMDMALADGIKNKMTIKHHGDMETKIEEAREIITEYKNTGNLFRNQVDTLAKRTISHNALRRFFTEVYQVMEGEIPMNPTTPEEEATHTKAVLTLAKWDNTFEREADDNPPSWWLAVNAVTNDIQHRIAARGRKAAPGSRAYSNLIGRGSKNSALVMKHALVM
jgi:phage/plasmid-like protein (TIGR03299 family)